MSSLLPTLDPHSLFLAAAVVQATFTLTLGLLAWADRRTHGMGWLASAAALEFCSTAFRLYRTFHDGTNWDVPGAAMLLATLLLMYRGLRWFVIRRELRSQSWPLALGATALAGVLFGFVAPIAGIILLRAATLAVVAALCNMLWDTRILALRSIARVSAVLCGCLMVVLLSRLILTLHDHAIVQSGLALFGREITLILVTLLEFSFIALFVSETNRRLHEETRMDPLTNLRNRRSIEETAARAVLQATNQRRPLSLLMLDLDRFKLLNDTWGHALGDRALRAVGGVLSNVVGVSEHVARLGGEEFAVLLPGADMEAAGVVAERLRATVEALCLSTSSESATLTVSIGVSTLSPGEHEWDAMLHRADIALYRAKTDGRNRVTLCDSEPARTEEPMPERQPGFWTRLLSGGGPVL